MLTRGRHCGFGQPNSNAMQTDKGMMLGGLRVEKSMTYRGMAAGSITVACGGRLHLYGMCGGDLIVEQGGAAIVHGMVHGSIVNQGYVELRGMVNGDVRTAEGEFQIASSGMVSGTIVR